MRELDVLTDRDRIAPPFSTSDHCRSSTPTWPDHAEAVVREAVSNAVRHADATEVSVDVRVEDKLCIDVVDNGRGIAGPVTESGLANLRHRAEEAGGQFSVGNAAGGATIPHRSAPLP